MAEGWVAPKNSLLKITKCKRYVDQLRATDKQPVDFTIYAQQYCFVTDSTDKAREQMKDGLFYVQRTNDESINWTEMDELSVSR